MVADVDAFATIDDGEVYIRNLHIPEYSQGTWTNHSPKRTRKLLLHRREIDKLMGQVRDGNKTLIPLKVYLKDGRAKCELGLAQGQQDYDKREAIKRRYPYLLPLNAVQLELLRRSRAGDDQFLVSKTIQVTMNGLATALRNAG